MQLVDKVKIDVHLRMDWCHLSFDAAVDEEPVGVHCEYGIVGERDVMQIQELCMA